MNFRQPNEDHFETSRMSFGEHLEELRKVLVRALIGVAIASVVGFWFAEEVIETLNEPLIDAIKAYNLEDASNELADRHGYVPPEFVPWMMEENRIPKQVLISPAELAKALQTVIPDFAEKVNLDPYGFRVSDFDKAKLSALCKRLSEQDGEDEATTKKLEAIWKAIPPSDQTTLSSIASKNEASTDDLIEVVGIFDQLSKLKSLNDSDAFADDLTESSSGFWSMFNAAKPKPLVKMKTKLDEENDEELSQQLNRALITSVFSKQMPVPKADFYAIEIWEGGKFKPQSLGVAEGFTVWLKAGLFSSLILAGPWISFQLWSFVATGLYPHEKKHIHVFLPISIFLFIAGVLLAFYFVFQPVLGFLFSFNRAMGIAPQMRINDWLSFVMFLPLGFGLAFQLPLVMLFMNRIGLFSIQDYLSKWRIAVMVIFFLAMFLTPADPISMLLLAIPLTLLYFLGIAMCRWMPRNENPFGEEAASSA